MWRFTTTWEKHLDSSLLAPAKVRERERRAGNESFKLGGDEMRGKGARRYMEDELKEERGGK